MTRVYRSPRWGSAAAATTPARLAREFGGQVRWRERPSGEIEVAILRDGRVDRCLVDEDGSTTLLASSPSSSASLWGKPVCIAGFLLCLAAIGGIAGANADDLSSRLKKLQVAEDEWHEPTNLGDWLPRSSEQLSAV